MPADLAERIERAYPAGEADETLIAALIDALERGEARALPSLTPTAPQAGA
jgi:hypothetical protein